MSFHELVDGRTRPLALPASVQAERKSRASCLRCNATRSTESNYDKSLRACVCVCNPWNHKGPVGLGYF